jgi:phage recombination protein Bet
MTNLAQLPTATPPKRKLLQQLADKYGVEPDIFERTVSAVAMPSPHTREELISCLIVANELDLNPLIKEIHFMRTKTGQIQPIVGVDGWVKKLNTHPQFNGMKFDYEWTETKAGKQLFAVTCTIYRKDRDHPTVVTEFMSECFRAPAPGKTNAWTTNPTRMLRHRSIVQGTRYAMGLAGVMDMDEFERWQEMRDITPPKATVPQLSELPDIPEPATEQPSAATVATEETQTVAGTRTDAEFQELFASALATAKDMDALTEHLMMNEDEIAERGLQQWARDQYEERKARLY